MIKEEEVRKKVELLKQIYADGLMFAIVNVILIFVWTMVDKNTIFWPKYVIVIWGISLIFKAYLMGILPLFFNRLSFLTAEWEENKIKELTGSHREQRRVPLHRYRK